jgi:hypothetical protein
VSPAGSSLAQAPPPPPDRVLGVPHVHQLWSRAAGTAGEAEASDGRQWAADRLTIHGLGLGLHETLEFLYSRRPSFADFEAWILEKNDGAIDPQQVALVNARVARLFGREPEPAAAALPADFEPVLGEAELLCWQEQGYVVLRDAVPPEACQATEQALWNFLDMDPAVPDGWYQDSHGHTIMAPLFHDPAFAENRRSPRIRAAFAQLWGTDDLQVTIDRGGFNPPERDGWRFPGPNLHWDTSLVPPIPLDIQGILYLTDTPGEQGAFRCVPGFHRRIDAWLVGLPPGVNPRTQDLSAEAVPIPARAGDMILWHDALPHGASANRGTRPRMVQYITWYPPGRADERPWI